MKTVVVTGGTGYIAGFVIKEFLEAGYAVRASVRSEAKGLALAQLFDNENLSTFVADLTSEQGWHDGIMGTDGPADGLIHVASPLGTGKETVEELSAIALGGTLNVLKAAKTAGLSRVVMTSSEAAATALRSTTATLTEDFWTDEANPELDAYRLSKVRAERAAWDFAKKNDLQLTTILPGAVFGPILDLQTISSNEIILAMLNGKLPFTVKVTFETSNTVDLAHLHRLAFEQEIAIGQRYLAASQKITMPEIAQLLLQHFPDQKSPKIIVPHWSIRLLAHFIPELRAFKPMLGRKYSYTTQKAETELGWQQQSSEETILQTAQSLIKHKLV